MTVSDLDRSIRFYRDVVGLPLALVLEERGAAFLWIGAPGQAMLGLWSLGSAPMGHSLHIALEASLADVLAACDGLRSNGIVPLSFFGAPFPMRGPDRVRFVIAVEKAAQRTLDFVHNPG